jgi:hypothetical protein
MGTENLSYALHDDPVLCNSMMEFTADFTIETLRPVLVDHTVSPDVSLENFAYYMKQKTKLMRGESF